MRSGRFWSGGRNDRSRRIRWLSDPGSVLLSADGLSNVAVAERVGVNQATVVKWRKRFIEGGVDGLIDEPRPGAPRKISDADVEEVIVRTLEDKPTDATYWSTRNLAKNVGMSASSVGRTVLTGCLERTS